MREENNYQNVELVKQKIPADDQASNPTEGDLEELLQDYKALFLKICTLYRWKNNRTRSPLLGSST